MPEIMSASSQWSFDQEGLYKLFNNWNGGFEYEVMGHYWFVVTRKGALDE